MFGTLFIVFDIRCFVVFKFVCCRFLNFTLYANSTYSGDVIYKLTKLPSHFSSTN